MAYDETLAGRIGAALAGYPDVIEQKMFGGIAFMIRGNLACGVVGDELMVRVGAEAHDAALAQPHARPMDFTGRPMKGLVYVGADGIADDTDLARWVRQGASYAASLPPK